MSDGRHGGGSTFTVYVGDGLGSNVQDQRIHQRDIVPCAWLIGYLVMQREEAEWNEKTAHHQNGLCLTKWYRKNINAEHNLYTSQEDV